MREVLWVDAWFLENMSMGRVQVGFFGAQGEEWTREVSEWE